VEKNEYQFNWKRPISSIVKTTHFDWKRPIKSLVDFHCSKGKSWIKHFSL
jgi:hypothetical protein